MALTKIITDNIDLSSDTTALKIPKGTTAERPAGTTGMIRENTDTGNVEVYNGSAWRALQQTGQDTGVVGINNFNSILYTGNGGTQSITTVFAPDLTWIKAREASASHALFDSIRGIYNIISSESTSSQSDLSPYGLTAFNSDGFAVSDIASGGNAVNGSPGGTYSGTNAYYVSWSWKAGGSGLDNFYKDSTGYASLALAGLTAGNLTPTKSSVNTEAGFSIINYTGDSAADSSFPHGLSSSPDLVIIKNKAANGTDWYVYSSSLAAGRNLILNSDSGFNTNNNIRSTSATTVTVSGDSTVNSSTASSMIAYSWTSIPGYSLIGSYEGSGLATDTPKIYTGFLPAWLMVKRTDSAGDFNIVDNKRSPSNPRTIELAANSAAAESAPGSLVNFNSDGFQIITTDTGWNAENGDYIFMCFAS